MTIRKSWVYGPELLQVILKYIYADNSVEKKTWTPQLLILEYYVKYQMTSIIS